MAESTTEDRRILRSRQALTDAFLALVVEQPYDEFTVGDVIERAGIGRSTFYEHFRNKDDLLRHSLGGALECLADMATPAFDEQRLAFWTTNMWENKRLGRIMLSGQARAYLVRNLAELIEARLPRGTGMRLASVQMAEAQLGLIQAWLSGVAGASAETVAGLLVRTARAMAGAAAG